MKSILTFSLCCLLSLLVSCNDAPDYEPVPDNSMIAILGDGSSQIIIGGDGSIINGQIGGGPTDNKHEPDNEDPNQSGDPGECTAHSFSDWYVTKSPTCTETGEQQRSCINCGEKETAALAETGHRGGEASCDVQAICTSCGQAYGNLNDHVWADASCILPKHCTVCSASVGSALGHTGGSASCDQMAVCTRCGNEYGNTEGHQWVDATCTSAKYCSVCSAVSGSELGHSYADDVCIRCGETNPNKPTVGHFHLMTFPITLIGGNGKITGAVYEISGDTLYITVTGEKTFSSGSLTIGWRVYGSGYDPVADGNATTPTYSKGESFTYTITVPNVITSTHRSYLVWMGLPLA